MESPTEDRPLRTGRFKRDRKQATATATAGASADKVRASLRARPREAAVVSWMRSLGERPSRNR